MSDILSSSKDGRSNRGQLPESEPTVNISVNIQVLPFGTFQFQETVFSEEPKNIPSQKEDEPMLLPQNTAVSFLITA